MKINTFNLNSRDLALFKKNIKCISQFKNPNVKKIIITKCKTNYGNNENQKDNGFLIFSLK